MLRRWLFVLSLLLTASLLTAIPSSPVSAQSASGAAQSATPAATAESEPTRARRAGMTTLGILSAFAAHEGGHIMTNLVFGNVPTVDGFLYGGFIPFFAIAPNIDCDGDHCVRRNGTTFHAGAPGKYLIVTGGFHVQHLTDEIILTREPELRAAQAPFRKGMLLFNVFLSCFYAAGYFTGLEDPHGDLGGAATASGIHEAFLATTLLVPAALDTLRYFRPQTRVVPWISRGTKVGFFGIALAL